MPEVSTRELKASLSRWVREVETNGDVVVITRSGRPVAALVSLADMPRRDVPRLLEDLARRGAVRLPTRPRPKTAFAGPVAPRCGPLASDMVSEDRR